MLEALDARLVSLARGEAALRLQLGQALEVLGRGGVFALGFSSLGAYAVERCERSVRWAETARCLARRIEVLPELREAVARGTVSWSMAEVLARAATPADEARWLDAAQSRTVRQMQAFVAGGLDAREALATGELERGHRAASGVDTRGGEAPELRTLDATADDFGAPSTAAAGVKRGGEARPGVCARIVGVVPQSERGADSGSREIANEVEMTTLTCTVNREDAWFFEATRCLLDQLGLRAPDDQSEALLAEARVTLQSLLQETLPESAPRAGDGRDREALQRLWLGELARWRARAEELCEKNILGTLLAGRAAAPGDGAGRTSVAAAAARGIASLEHLSCEALDVRVRALARALARRELELSVLLLAFHRGDGWRRLGYASEAQYARERLGASPSLLLARRALALRLETLPGVAAALGAGQIGVEAALQVVRVATASTEAAWVLRAQRRTIKHLREEVAAALTAVRVSGELGCPPPLDDEIEAFHRLEQAVVSGRIGLAAAGEGSVANDNSGRWRSCPLSEPASAERRAWFVMLGSLASWLESGLQTSAANAGGPARGAAAAQGRVVLRLRMSRENAASWRELEAQARRWLPRGMSWLRFVCSSLWHAWQHVLGSSVAYGHIYIRDRFRCMSPVCPRRDVTPHHLQFRSAGGGDEDENLGSVCTWCHLHGIHGGRIRARGPARCIRWELGARGSPCVVVQGRERVAA